MCGLQPIAQHPATLVIMSKARKAVLVSKSLLLYHAFLVVKADMLHRRQNLATGLMIWIAVASRL
jgi:hypothetical protein